MPKADPRTSLSGRPTQLTMKLGLISALACFRQIKHIASRAFQYHFNKVYNTSLKWYSIEVRTVPKSGKEVLKLYEENGWSMLRQKGSHVVVGKGTERETIPMHKELKTGLEKKLLKRIGVK